MATLSAAALASTMLGAARESLGKSWKQVKDFAPGEMKKLAETLVQIGKLSALGRITPGEASVLLDMQKNTARTVLLTIQGMGLIAVEMAINAALGAVRDLVNGALGFALI
jgi:hypothetical protein